MLLNIAAVCITITSVLIMSIKNWRLALGILTVQYVGVFSIIIQVLPFEMAIVKLVSGWMAVFILWLAANESFHGSSRTNFAPVTPSESQPSLPANKPINKQFLLATAILVGLVVASQIQEISQWIPGIPPMMLWSALILVGVGFLILGFTDQVLTTILGILTMLSGFEIFYAPMQNSLLVTGLLACFSVGVAFVGAYVLLSPLMETE